MAWHEIIKGPSELHSVDFTTTLAARETCESSRTIGGWRMHILDDITSVEDVTHTQCFEALTFAYRILKPNLKLQIPRKKDKWRENMYNLW